MRIKKLSWGTVRETQLHLFEIAEENGLCVRVSDLGGIIQSILLPDGTDAVLGYDTPEEYLRRVNLLRSSIVARNVVYNWHDAETSLIEAVLSRGDRKIGDVIEAVWRKGGRLEAWSDFFSWENWMQAFAECGIDPAFYAHRERSVDETLPWDVIDVGVRKQHLVHEREMAYAAQLSPDCRKQCSGCGAAAYLTKGGRCDG